jgi:hypothetical protein
MGGGMKEKQEVKIKPKRGGYIHLRDGVRSLEEALDNWEKIQNVKEHSEPEPPTKKPINAY